MIVSTAIEKMIAYYEGDQRSISHFMRVWGYARTIGELEQLDAHTQEVLELAAVVHDIACPICIKKYGDACGKNQEKESAPLVAEFFAQLPVAPADVERISWLVCHHHTYTDVDGIDHRILLEADYLVNAGSRETPKEAIEKAREVFYRTAAGTRLLESIYLNHREG